MAEGQTEKEGFVQPTSLVDVVSLATQFAEVIADVDWVVTSAGRAEVAKHVHSLVMTIIHVPMKPPVGEHTLTYRLARAEAERLYGACTLFEGACKKLGVVAGSEGALDEAATEELGVADYQLSAALRAFIAMAIDIQ